MGARREAEGGGRQDERRPGARAEPTPPAHTLPASHPSPERSGAHTFFLRQGEVARWGGYTVNLIHYQDAAALCCAVLRGQGTGGAYYRARTFLGCDGAPVTFDVRAPRAYIVPLVPSACHWLRLLPSRLPAPSLPPPTHKPLPSLAPLPQDMMSATLATGAFGDGGVTFTAPEGPVKGKRMSNELTRRQLGWQPQHGSYVEFMAQTGARDWYTKAAALAPAGAPHAG